MYYVYLASGCRFFWGGGYRGDSDREMNQTLLTFGGKVVKPSNGSPSRVCVHEKLHTIRSCKRCYTIAALRQRCTNTISFKTGHSLGTYGTKKELLARLIKNVELHKNNNDFVGKFVCLNVISCFVFVPYFSKCFHN